MKTPALFLAVLIGFATMSCSRADDWPISAPAEAGLDASRLAQMDVHIQARLPHVRSLLVARHGHLVFERYYGNASRDKLQNIQSMTKSVSSALIGIALRKGLVTSLENKALDYFPEYRDSITDQRMRDVTIRHLLTMSSGIDAVRGSFDKVMADPLPEILRQRLLYAPGGGFRYSDLGAHLVGGVLRKATGMSVLEFANRELFDPLGMQRGVWYADKSGLQSGGMSGLWRARDVLKLGELYLRKGTWKGAELIPPAFVAESVTVQNSGDFFGEPVRYGYAWFIKDVAGHETYYARGYGGQYLMVVPKAGLVILCTSDWARPEYPEHFALVEQFVLPAIVSQ